MCLETLTILYTERPADPQMGRRALSRCNLLSLDRGCTRYTLAWSDQTALHAVGEVWLVGMSWSSLRARVRCGRVSVGVGLGGPEKAWWWAEIYGLLCSKHDTPPVRMHSSVEVYIRAGKEWYERSKEQQNTVDRPPEEKRGRMVAGRRAPAHIPRPRKPPLPA